MANKNNVNLYLILTWGNPSRGDDAIGPEIYDHLVANPLPDTDVLTDFQLQIEHSQDLAGRQAVIFVDASIDCMAPYDFREIQPNQDYTYTTHAMSPQAVLSVYQQVNQQPPPAAYLLSVRGTQFELGQSLSAFAENNMQAAIGLLEKIVQLPQADWLSMT